MKTYIIKTQALTLTVTAKSEKQAINKAKNSLLVSKYCTILEIKVL